MAGRIKGITVEIGGDTTGLDKALQNQNASNSIRDALRPELKKALDNYPSSAVRSSLPL